MSGSNDNPEKPKTPARVAQELAMGAAVRHTMRAVTRAFLAVLGAFLIIIGIPLAILTPFPFVPIGLPVVITGVVLLGRNSLIGRRFMEGVLTKWPKVEKFAPNWLMKLVFGRDKKPEFRKPDEQDEASDTVSEHKKKEDQDARV